MFYNVKVSGEQDNWPRAGTPEKLKLDKSGEVLFVVNCTNIPLPAGRDASSVDEKHIVVVVLVFNIKPSASSSLLSAERTMPP